MCYRWLIFKRQVDACGIGYTSSLPCSLIQLKGEVVATEYDGATVSRAGPASFPSLSGVEPASSACLDRSADSSRQWHFTGNRHTVSFAYPLQILSG